MRPIKRVSIAPLLALFCLLLLAGQTGLAEPGDVVLKRYSPSLGDFAPATFPHWIHQMQFKCPTCHDALFKMKAGSSRISMSDILAGKFCGKCHNGKVAFAPTFTACNRCHRK